MNPMEMHASRKVWEHRLKRGRAKLVRLNQQQEELARQKAEALHEVLVSRRALLHLGGEQIQVICEDEGCPHHGVISHIHASGAVAEADVEAAEGVHPYRDDEW